MKDSMLLLHISDIHFSDPVCHTNMDPDLPFRTALIQDIKRRVSELGEVQAILVSGDIAFHGLISEYNAALTWVKELATAAKCPVGNIFVIPGNHDVDRNIIIKKANVRNAHNAVLLLRGDPKRRDQEFFAQLSDPEVRKVLIESVQSYNEFAAHFDCQLYLPERLFWTKDFALNESFVLRMYGLTSTILSGAGAVNHEEDKPDSLYLSPYQTAFNPVAGVISLMMCHHPPDWFMDHDAIEEALKDRAAIQLFGHKHRQRALKDEGYVRFGAGAVIPDRYETGWEPGYNFIKLTVDSGEKQYSLEIEAHVMIWQTNPGLFRKKEYSGGVTVFRHKILLIDPPSAQELTSQKDQTERNQKDLTGVGHAEGIVTPPVGMEAEMTDAQTRDLVFRFWELSSSQRREITQALGLIDETDMKLPEPERYGRAFLRAKERGLVEQFSNKITEMEKR